VGSTAATNPAIVLENAKTHHALASSYAVKTNPVVIHAQTHVTPHFHAKRKHRANTKYSSPATANELSKKLAVAEQRTILAIPSRA
jgi:hypothetical protein